VVLNGADEAVFDPAARPRHEHPGEFHIVSHGSIEERYGLDTAIEAVALLRDDLPGLRLRIYGDGSRRASLQALARDLGVADRAWFSDGYVPLDELVQALTDADAGLVAIRRDVFRDLVLCHKMYDFISMRVPAIVSRTRSVEAYFDEACFELFEAGDATDLARAIKAVQEDPARRAEMVRAATAAGERHRWPHQAAVYVASVEGVSGSS
jgi:glycosyltransferase involved in cell wall biosynthesis